MLGMISSEKNAEGTYEEVLEETVQGARLAFQETAEACLASISFYLQRTTISWYLPPGKPKGGGGKPCPGWF
jgi:hypothetical protein